MTKILTRLKLSREKISQRGWRHHTSNWSALQLLGVIEKEIERLPPRQREAFLMRYWEEMDIAETAAAMGCSEGSVKTHCSRATHTLAAALKAKGIEL
jgi:RNA polymerase sigma factor (sigma-70 family)